MRQWFIGDSVIVRYETEPDGRTVRVTPRLVDGTRRYRCSCYDAHGQQQGFNEWPTLREALEQGERWLP